MNEAADDVSAPLAWLATLIAGAVPDDHDSCPRSVLLDAYNERFPKPSEPAILHEGEADWHKTKNSEQAFLSEIKGTRWTRRRRTVGGHAIKGKRPKDRLSSHLNMLERLGVVERVGAESVRVLDWVRLVTIMNTPEGDPLPEEWWVEARIKQRDGDDREHHA